ncbi:hypothetical protein BDC45DRAFT_597232 [Circinella umbellata]|nr:hypothetical protein BDC45DRAFT_597232 [Circinella umbellata]
MNTQQQPPQQQQQHQAYYQSVYPQYAHLPPPPDWYVLMQDVRSWMAKVDDKPDASKIMQGLIRKHFIGEVLQLTGPNEVAMMDTMVKIVDKFHKRLVAVWDAHPNKTIKTFHGLAETARDKLAMDVSIYLKHHLNDIPIDLLKSQLFLGENFKLCVSLYLVYYLFEKHISTSQRLNKKQALVHTASMYSGSYMDTASEGGLPTVMSSTFFEDEDDNSIAANASLRQQNHDKKNCLRLANWYPIYNIICEDRNFTNIFFFKYLSINQSSFIKSKNSFKNLPFV